MPIRRDGDQDQRGLGHLGEMIGAILEGADITEEEAAQCFSQDGDPEGTRAAVVPYPD
jgi:hypothetical protein